MWCLCNCAQSIAGMGNIFISYRRDDSIATAGRMRDKLVQVFGRQRVFVDVDDIPHGRDFVKILEGKVAECDVLLAVIGPRWLDARDAKGNRRLDDRKDFVGIEVGSALQREAIAVIPILVDGARMPTADELPEPLKPLARRNAIELRNTQFGSDAERLIHSIRAATGETQGRAWGKAVLALVVAGVLSGGGYFAWPIVERMVKGPERVEPSPLPTTITASSSPSLAGQGGTKVEVAAALGRLRAVLGPAEGRIDAGLRGGNRVRLGEQIVFEITSRVPGRLILIDLNAAGEVLQIFPNSFVPVDLVARIPAGPTITVPGAGYGFSGFKAVEPVGRGQLLALVQPDSVPAGQLPRIQAQITKGFEPVQAPGAYLTQLADIVASATGGAGPSKVTDWAFAVTEYEIVR